MEYMNTISDYLKKEFGSKTVKLAIDGGFTCPNRDGTKSTGGCIFCGDSGSGDFASDIDTSIRLLSEKWPKAKYLAYFQNHTNTYAPVSELRQKFYAALDNPLIEGIVIATRPDCISEEALDLLDEINQKHFMWVELGLQTMHDSTGEAINRCYPTAVYQEAMQRLNSRGIKVVTHLILGLPGETREMMKESLNYVISCKTWGLKLHLLNVVKGSQMEITHHDYNSFDELEDYVEFITDLIEITPPEIVIHRLTGDAPRNVLITPCWSYKKRTILNGINAELKRRKSFQGCKLNK